MRSKFSPFLLSAVAAVWVLSACSSSAPGVGRQFGSVSHPASKGPSDAVVAVCNNQPNLLYVSQFNANTVNIYNNPATSPNNPPIATITPGQGLNNPAGMIVDPVTTILYVANFSAQNVLLFKKCGTGPGATLFDAPFNPIDVAISSGSSGAVYVSNFTAPSVTVFPLPNSNYTPSLTLTDPNARSGMGITIDKFGDCFWSFVDNSGQGRVDRFKGCLMPAIPIALFTPVNGPPGGVQLDFPNNRLLLNDQIANRTYRIPSPWTGSPFLFPQATGAQPLFLALRNNESRLYVADGANGAVQRYKYPSAVMQGPLTNGLTAAGGVMGVTVFPPAPL